VPERSLCAWYCYLAGGKRIDCFGVPPADLDCLAVDFRPVAPREDAPFFEAIASRFSGDRNKQFFSDISGVDLSGTDATWMLIPGDRRRLPCRIPIRCPGARRGWSFRCR